MNLRTADIEESALKIISHKTEKAGFINEQEVYYTELIFEDGYYIKFKHYMGHIQNMSNHIDYIQ